MKGFYCIRSIVVIHVFPENQRHLGTQFTSPQKQYTPDRTIYAYRYGIQKAETSEQTNVITPLITGNLPRFDHRRGHDTRPPRTRPSPCPVRPSGIQLDDAVVYALAVQERARTRR